MYDRQYKVGIPNNININLIFDYILNWFHLYISVKY